MRSLWRAIAIVLLLPLGGCFADQEQQLASCKLEALRTYPNEPDVILDAKIEDYMATCMETHGYKFSFAPSACKVTTTSFKRESHCYVPTSLIGRLIDRLKNWRLTHIAVETLDQKDAGITARQPG